jgi:hypothetical protein
MKWKTNYEKKDIAEQMIKYQTWQREYSGAILIGFMPTGWMKRKKTVI